MSNTSYIITHKPKTLALLLGLLYLTVVFCYFSAQDHPSGTDITKDELVKTAAHLELMEHLYVAIFIILCLLVIAVTTSAEQKSLKQVQ